MVTRFRRLQLYASRCASLALPVHWPTLYTVVPKHEQPAW